MRRILAVGDAECDAEANAARDGVGCNGGADRIERVREPRTAVVQVGNLRGGEDFAPQADFVDHSVEGRESISAVSDVECTGGIASPGGPGDRDRRTVVHRCILHRKQR